MFRTLRGFSSRRETERLITIQLHKEGASGCRSLCQAPAHSPPPENPGDSSPTHNNEIACFLPLLSREAIHGEKLMTTAPITGLPGESSKNPVRALEFRGLGFGVSGLSC